MQYDIEFGTALYRGQKKIAGMKHADRFRHTYMIGKTGAGKTTLYQNMALQDINAGRGVVFVDPHGEAIEWLLERVPKNRIDDVIVFDPSNTDFPVGLNLLEWHNEQEKDFLVSEAIQIFYKIFDPQQSGVIGPQFEHWMRNAALTVMADPEGGTLLEIPRLFVDKNFELHKRKFLKDPIVMEFWEKQMAKTADFHRSEMLNYFSSKFGRFMTNSMMKNIIGQKKSSINIREIIDGEKILLINLSKGKVGEMNAQMLGLILMTKLQLAVLGRAHVPAEQRHPCYLYVDEFQNLLTDAFISMLSESRKYGLAVHLTNQYIAQLPENIRNAVLGNIGTLITFQIGAMDAEFLKKEMAPLDENDLQNVPLRHFYLRTTIDGSPFEPFLVKAQPPAEADSGADFSEIIKTLSELRYGELNIY
ncbi:type IV secretion system DNA-binding domain-containing protein [Patescibacteria group bacterium]|nr:type IV secretion system DNA-binding domain-containing protein [Patescibacteria group bacterium]